ncbi:hypothetical protein ABZ897_00455 [Nonomuraea sp. NPDC046802]|uniref:hypothetical protein n=1 Tax=Nonomuraea sp. NPDC046802 TaxID=3154919 RepID=UPI0033DBA356
MASGVEHYRKAEEYAEQAAKHISDADEWGSHGRTVEEGARREWAKEARDMGVLHATLALAAATGLKDYPDGMPLEDVRAWRDVAGVKPEGGA